MSFVIIRFFTILFLWQSIIFSSVCMETLIKTSQDTVIAASLSSGCELIGYSVEDNTFLQSVITDMVTITIDSVVEIITENGCVYVPQDLLFFDPVIQKWIVAKDLTEDNYFLNAQLHHIKCLHVKSFCIVPTIAYRISTAFPHTFFVTEQELLIHNFLPVVVGVSWLFGLGSIEFAGFNIAAIVAGTAIGMKLFKSKKHKHKNNEASVVVRPYVQSAGGGSPDPNDDDEKDSEKNKRKFNTVSKSEFFKKVKDQYEYWKDGIYKKRPGAQAIENAEFLKWDHLHGEVEAYSKSQTPLGAIDPKTLRIYKVVSKFRKML